MIARYSPGRRAGFTWMELVVVLILGATLLGIVIVFVVQQRETGKRVGCTNNLRLLGNAVQGFHEKHFKPTKLLPPARIAEGYATWTVVITPYLASTHPLHKWDTSKPYLDQPADVREAILPEMICPARQRESRLSVQGDGKPGNHLPGAIGDYGCVAGDGQGDWTGPSANGAIIFGEVLDKKDDRIVKWTSRTSIESLKRGLSYTLLVGDKHVPKGAQGQANVGDGSVYNGQYAANAARVAGVGFGLAPSEDAPFNNNFGSAHPAGCQFLYADLSVRTITVDINETVLGGLARRDD